MPITRIQRERRMNHLGSSDIAAIFGRNPWQSAYDVYLSKTGQLEDTLPNDAMEAGTRFEDGVLSWAEDQLGPGVRNQYRSLPELHIGSNMDLVLREQQEPVEGKTAGLFSPLREEWGAEGTDEVPKHVIFQATVHMMCLKSKPGVCHVAAFLGGRGFVMFRVARDDMLVGAIERKAPAWWERHVVNREPPTDCLPSMDSLKTLRRLPQKTVEVPAAILLDYEAINLAEKQAKEHKDNIKAQILTAMGDGDAVQADGLLYTFFEQTRNGFDAKRLRLEEPGIAARFATTSTHRKLIKRKVRNGNTK